MFLARLLSCRSSSPLGWNLVPRFVLASRPPVRRSRPPSFVDFRLLCFFLLHTSRVLVHLAPSVSHGKGLTRPPNHLGARDIKHNARHIGRACQPAPPLSSRRPSFRPVTSSQRETPTCCGQKDGSCCTSVHIPRLSLLHLIFRSRHIRRPSRRGIPAYKYGASHRPL